MACNLTIRARRGEHPERLIRRFTKKVKKMKILEQYRASLRFEKPSDKKRREKNKRIRDNKRDKPK
jgi:ribosomal protein S21